MRRGLFAALGVAARGAEARWEVDAPLGDGEETSPVAVAVLGLEIKMRRGQVRPEVVTRNAQRLDPGVGRRRDDGLVRDDDLDAILRAAPRRTVTSSQTAPSFSTRCS